MLPRDPSLIEPGRRGAASYPAATPRASPTRSRSSTAPSTRGRCGRHARRARLPDVRATATARTCSATAIAASAREARWVEVPALKLGLLTAAFPDLSLEEVADWAARQRLRDARDRLLARGGRRARRYAGVSHIDVDVVRRRRACASSSDSTASRSRRSPTTRTTCIPTTTTREAANAHLRKVIDAAQALGVRDGRHVRRERQGPPATRRTSRGSSRSGRRSSRTRKSAACRSRSRTAR